MKMKSESEVAPVVPDSATPWTGAYQEFEGQISISDFEFPGIEKNEEIPLLVYLFA